MKKLFIVLLAVVSLSSCQLTEEITFNQDGSGDYKLTIDMSAMMAMKGNSKNQDSTQTSPKNKKIDSIINFNDIAKKYKDSVKTLSADEKELMKRMQNLQVHIQVDDEAKKMLMSFNLPFKSASEIQNIQKDLKQVDKMQKGKKASKNMFGDVKKTDVKYTFNAHEFTRTIVVKENKNKKDAVKKEEKKDTQMADMMKMFTFKMIYHFPKKIKHVSYKDAMLGTDGKTLIIQTSLDKIDSDSDLKKLRVTFE